MADVLHWIATASVVVEAEINRVALFAIGRNGSRGPVGEAFARVGSRAGAGTCRACPTASVVCQARVHRFANSCNNTVSLVTRLTYTVAFACRLRLALRTAYVSTVAVAAGVIVSTQALGACVRSSARPLVAADSANNCCRTVSARPSCLACIAYSVPNT